PPHLHLGLDRGEPFAAGSLGRDRGIVNQRVQLAGLESALDLGNRRERAVAVAEVDLDVILRSRFPRAVFWERMPRAGDHVPTGGGKTLHRGVADAAAGAGEEQGTARLVGR